MHICFKMLQTHTLKCYTLMCDILEQIKIC